MLDHRDSRPYFRKNIAGVLVALAQARPDWIECLIAVGASFELDAGDIQCMPRVALCCACRRERDGRRLLIDE